MSVVVAKFARFSSPTAMLLAGFALLLGSGGLRAQTVDQTLDSIVTFGQTRVQGVVQTPSVQAIPFTTDPLQPIVGTDFKACQGAGPRGMYCLDGTGASAVVKNYPDPDNSTTATVEVTCANLGLSSCTAMTIGLGGQIWLAGQKGVGYSLVKSVLKGDDPCPLGTTATSNSKYCYREYAANRPKIYQISMIDGPAGDYFQGNGPGVLSLEEPGPTSIVYYRDSVSALPITIAAGNTWNSVLATGEVFQAVTLLQLRYTNPVTNFVLVSTNTGKVYGYLLPWSGNTRAFDTNFRYASLATTSGPSCTPASPYDLKTSARTRRTYFTSGTCIAAFDPVISGTGNRRSVGFPTQGFKLATTYNLVGVTVSPGVEIDYVRNGCVTSAGCTLLADGADGNNIDAARFANVKIVDGPSGWVLYQVTGLVDCRWINPRPAICTPATIVDPSGAGDPSKQYLNITPMLPPEITGAFPAGAVPPALPPMLLQPDYRARKTIPQPAGSPARGDFTFDALFGIPQRGLIYRETFDGQFDLEDLIGSKLATDVPDVCTYGAILDPRSATPPPFDPIVNISEIASTVGGPGMAYPPNLPPSVQTKNWVSALLNDGCFNPTSLAGGRGSAFLYGLELAPKIPVKVGNTTEWRYPDSSFALLMRSLARDFDAHLYTYACTDLDGSSASPLDSSTCYQLQKDWPVVYDKLTKCINATDQPKTSAGSQNCGSFETQFPGFRTAVLNAIRSGPDPQNRVGELKSRMIVLSYMYYSWFLPSIKDRGFSDPNQIP